ncbi:MAG: prolipoprotein diacylglyceryl transferase [Dehalococcoidia bacterium]
MSGIEINIDPIIFRFGSFALGWYGLAIALAIIAALFVAVREGQRKGIGKDVVYSLALWGIVAGFIGARLFHVVDKLDYYAANPWAIFAVHQGGLAIWGGVAGGTLAVAIYARVRGLPLARLADGAVPALLVAQIIGRIGCIVNGDAYGGTTGLPWGFIYTHPDASIPSYLWGVATHPYPVYEMLWNFAVLLLLWRIRKRVRIDGLLFFAYLFFYSLGRFVLTFVRQERIWFWELQEAQVIALFVLLASVLAVLYLQRKRMSRTGLIPVADDHGNHAAQSERGR